MGIGTTAGAGASNPGPWRSGFGSDPWAGFRLRPGTNEYAMYQMSKLSTSVQRWIRSQPDGVRAQIFESARYNDAGTLNRFLSTAISQQNREAEQANRANVAGTDEFAWRQLSMLSPEMQANLASRSEAEKRQIFEAARTHTAAQLTAFFSTMERNQQQEQQAVNRAWQVMASLSEETKAWISQQPESVKQQFFNEAKTNSANNLEVWAQGMRGQQEGGMIPAYPMPPSGGGGGGGAGGVSVQTLPGGTAPGSTGGGSSSAGPRATPIANGDMGGTVYRFGGQAIIVFRVNGVTIWYDNAESAPLQGGHNLTDPTQLRNLQAELNNGVKGGDSAELVSIKTEWGSYQKFWENILDKWFQKDNPARNDPGVLKVMAQLAARPDMSETELYNLLSSTEYYDKLTDVQRKWNDLSDAEKQYQINEMASRLAEAYFLDVGTPINAGNAEIIRYATDIVSGKRSYEGVIGTWVRQQAEKNPESPWMRKVRAEEENQRRRPFDIEQKAGEIRALTNQWGIQMAEGTLQKWANDIVSMTRSDDDLLEALKDQAQVLYPWKDRELSTEEAAQPWIQTYQRVMEKPADVFNGQVQKALSAGQAVFDFERELKSSEQWETTSNFQEEATKALGDIGRRMGFN